MSGINGKRDHFVFDSAVYAGINKCPFIPDCVFERVHHVLKIDDNLTLSVFESDNKKYHRIVLFNNGVGVAGILVNIKSAEIIYMETSPEYKGMGYNRQLRAYYTIKFKRVLHAQHMTSEGEKALYGIAA